jgi:S-adenosylmethionine:tRNA ribosyltransferase-isomerase
MYSLKDYNYKLPAKLIAQKPVEKRDQSNLMVLERDTGDISHYAFRDLSRLLSPTDVLVVNDTAVVPGRLFGRKDTGGKVEVLISDFSAAGEAGSEAETNGDGFTCNCLLKAAKRPRPGSLLYFKAGIKAKVIESCNGTHTVKFYYDGDLASLLDRIGEVPLPPYIQRNSSLKPPCDDRSAYQTVYASAKGAIAAPTAGLHFTKQLLKKLTDSGIEIVRITLHVGYGTFFPVRVSDIREHKMHAERFIISKAAAETINSAKTDGKRIVAVGTTCVRALEYAADKNGMLIAGEGSCDLYLLPGYRFKVVEAMITNFHLPESTLLMLVSAFAGKDNIFRAYQEAIKKSYRFYSYGDAMLIV